MSVLWLVPYGDNWGGGVVERNGSICANNLHKQSPSLTPWQCLVWLEEDPPVYSCCLPPLHTSGPSHILLQIGLSFTDLEGEYRGGVIEEELEDEGGDVSIE